MAQTLRDILLSKTFVVTCYCGNEILATLANPIITCSKCGMKFGHGVDEKPKPTIPIKGAKDGKETSD